MTEENHLALIVALFLSKFDVAACKSLGCSSWKETFEEVGQRLQVNPNTVKQMREQFDPIILIPVLAGMKGRSHRHEFVLSKSSTV